jgi:hypothetical protein
MEFVFDSALDRACRIIFGPEVSVNHTFLNCLNPSRIKTVFRKKALLVHPDRLSAFDNKTRERYTRLFIEAKWAYDHLRKFCEERDNGNILYHGGKRVSHKPRQTHKRSNKRSSSSGVSATHRKTWYYTGLMPKRKLLFGEFLFYSRIIPWDVFIKAVVHQQKERPRFGNIAESWKYLTEAEIRYIVSGKKFNELIGEAAERMGMMNRFQVGAVLYHQRLVQRPIGEYLIEHGSISNLRLQTYLKDFQNSNEKFADKRF